MTPGTYDFSIVRGTAGPTQGLVFRLKAQDGDNLVNIPFEDVRLTINKGSALIQRLALSNGRLYVSDPSEAEITWEPTTQETRALYKGDKNQYELEVWNGTTEIVYMMGTITGIGGINDDQTDQVTT